MNYVPSPLLWYYLLRNRVGCNTNRSLIVTFRNKRKARSSEDEEYEEDD